LVNLKNGVRQKVKDIAIEEGFSPLYAGSGQIQETKSYQEVIVPALQRMITIRDKVLVAIEARNLSHEALFDLNNTLKVLNHDIQLLSGGNTEKFGFEEDRKVIIGILAEIREPRTEEALPRPAQTLQD